MPVSAVAMHTRPQQRNSDECDEHESGLSTFGHGTAPISQRSVPGEAGVAAQTTERTESYKCTTSGRDRVSAAVQ